MEIEINQDMNIIATFDNPFGCGAGTIENLYLVENAAHLDNIRNYLDSHFLQIDDIDLSVYENWDPIGDDEIEFTGTFDGDGFEITNLNTNRPNEDYVGLFGCMGKNSTIENVVLKIDYVFGSRGTGGLVGMNYEGTITNSYAAGNVTTGEGRGSI